MNNYIKSFPQVILIFIHRSDGAFSVSNLPSGSYSIEVINPTYVFEPARIDITSKGKFRARKMNNIQLNAVAIVNIFRKILNVR